MQARRRDGRSDPRRLAIRWGVSLGLVAGLVMLVAAASSGDSAPPGAFSLSVGPGAAAVARAVRGAASWSSYLDPAATPRSIRVGDLLPAGARVRTGPGALLDLELGDGRSLRVTGRTVLTLAPGEGRAVDSPNLFLFLGRIWVNLRRELAPGERFTVETPAAVVGVRGTMFTVAVGPDGETIAAVHRGKVEISGGEVAVQVTAGHQVSLGVGHVPGNPAPLSQSEQGALQAQREWVEDDPESGGAGELDSEEEKDEEGGKEGGEQAGEPQGRGGWGGQG